MNTWSHLLGARSPPGNRPHLGGRGEAPFPPGKAGPCELQGRGRARGGERAPRGGQGQGTGQRCWTGWGAGCGHRCPGCAEPGTEQGPALPQPRHGREPRTAPQPRGPRREAVSPQGSGARGPGSAGLLRAALPPEMSSLCSVPCFNAFSVDVCNV